MLKKSLLILGLVFTYFSFPTFGQQDPQYSMYMFNGMSINPAYAGSREKISLTALYRHQWSGMDGAPRTISFNAHSPLLNDRIGLGLSVVNDRIGVTNTNHINGAYAYRLPTDIGRLSFGIQGGFSHYNSRWSDLVLNDAGDNNFSSNSPNLFLPNFGFGIYLYDHNRYYVGVSAPQLLNNSLNESLSLEGTNNVARQFKHYFFTAGYVAKLNEFMKFKPSVLLKYVHGAPLQADFNASLLFYDALWVGASYRTGDSFVFMVEYYFGERFRAGYAYDYTITELNNYTSGSHEIMIGYEFSLDKDAYLTPRRISYF
ncbi:MAG: type IX secretion system membrane protein PorP/SprF [Chitinophagaceae bacterium]|nr:MAG: type IX secretion system membrane protein PorP/SprF [Chitinophagaceae bacterium]